MEKKPFKPELFKQFLANESNAAELNQLFDHFRVAEQQELEALIISEFENEATSFDVSEESRLDLIYAELNQKLFVKPESRILKAVKSNDFIRIAATFLVIGSIALLVFKFANSGISVVPGSAKAVLKFGGKETELSEKRSGVIYHSAGVTVTAKKDGSVAFMAVDADSLTASKLNTVSTPRGGEFKITLSDGSIVMLNAGSKLTFPTGFRGAERKVYVDGEAFFKVAKNREKPFIVSIAGSEVKVLGTQFNVSNYPESNGTEATLLEGSINFSNNNGKEVILKPNQQVLSSYGKLTVKEVSADDFNAWTKGEFLFNDVPLAVVMQKLARWYNVEVDPETMPKKNLYIKISRKADINEVLEMISAATKSDFALKANKIVFEE